MKLPFLLSLCLTATAAGALSPTEIQSRIDRQGGHKVLWALWANPTQWDEFISGIESGESSWLKIAQRLHPYSDAGASEDLHNAVARALPKAAERVLSMVGPGFEIEHMCTSPFVEAEPGVAEVYEREALAALASVRAPKLKALAGECANLIKLPPPAAGPN